ncbi:restriction endonuclease [Bacillus mycoides]|uniref:Restriction endonuclease n=1 Tax=Bacillus mycoides TaxID=1405 RepID=A0A1W6AGW1_BACMY|nr:HNH endonuclease [Bacillus mycoides]ARJ25114.1 restriction endonuclease [Bacillus mycoides]
MKTRLKQKQIMEHFNIPRETLDAMEQEGLPFYKISARDKEYDIEKVTEWLKIIKKDIDTMVIGKIYDNSEIVKRFKCGNMGGMRRSKKTNTLVLFSDHTKGIYDDRWDKDILFYTGMGQEGHQTLDGNQNKTLYESNENGVGVYLFEAFQPGEHIFMGQARLVEQPFQETQEDTQGQKRKVWVFPICILKDGVILPENVILSKQEKEQKEARKLDYQELKERAKKATSNSNKRYIKTEMYQRNEFVAEFSKRRANGMCELCEQKAPFEDKKGNPYLESHHVEWLSNGGKDSIYNTVGVCANCHRKLHVLNDEADVTKLKDKLKQYKLKDKKANKNEAK